MNRNDAVAQLVLLASAEDNFNRADLDLQIAREQFVEIGLSCEEAYERAWIVYVECGMMYDLSKHLKYNVDREAENGSTG